MPGHPCFPGRAEAWHIELKGTGCNGDVGTYAGNMSGAPLGGAVSNALRSALGMSQPVATQGVMPSQSVSSSQSPIQAFEDSQTVPTTGVSSQIDTSGGPTHATSIADRLEELAFGATTQQTTQTQAGTSVPLIVSGGSAAGIASSQTHDITQQPLPPGISGISQQTFISGDLSWQDASLHATQTPLQRILMAIKAILLGMLQYLQPFGGRSLHEEEYELL